VSPMPCRVATCPVTQPQKALPLTADHGQSVSRIHIIVVGQGRLPDDRRKSSIGRKAVVLTVTGGVLLPRGSPEGNAPRRSRSSRPGGCVWCRRANNDLAVGASTATLSGRNRSEPKVGRLPCRCPLKDASSWPAEVSRATAKVASRTALVWRCPATHHAGRRPSPPPCLLAEIVGRSRSRWVCLAAAR